MKTRTNAILWCFFLGWVGAHKFYMGKNGLGTIYLLLFWTQVPGLIAFLDLIKLITMSDDDFNNSLNTSEDIEVSQSLISSGVIILLICGVALIFTQSCNSLNNTCNYSTLQTIETVKSVLPYLFGAGGISLIAGFIKASGVSNNKVSVTKNSSFSKDSTDTLYELKKLYDEGIITAEEYEEKRKKLLKNI